MLHAKCQCIQASGSCEEDFEMFLLYKPIYKYDPLGRDHL